MLCLKGMPYSYVRSEWRILDGLREPDITSGTARADITWPSPDIQNHLLSLYVENFHPLFPILNVSAINTPSLSTIRKVENEFQILNIFAVASRYSDHTRAPEAGSMYFTAAKSLISGFPPF